MLPKSPAGRTGDPARPDPRPAGTRPARHPVVAEVTRNPALAGDPACLSIDAATPDGRATGFGRDCVVSCPVLVTVDADTLVQTLGRLSPAMQAERDACLKAAMALP